MYLRISDERFVLDNNYDVIYQDTKMSHTVMVDQYVCLFDNDWKIVDEVWEYLQYLLHVKKIAFSTAVVKGSDLKLFYEFLQKHKSNYRTITPNAIHDFSAWLLHHDLKPINRILQSIKSFYQYHQHHSALTNPFDVSNSPTRPAPSSSRITNNPILHQHLKIKEFDRGIRILSKDQIQIILDACTMQRDRILFELLLFTGIQISEALGLDISSLAIPAKKPLTLDEDNTQTKSYYHQHKTSIQDLNIPALLMEKISSYYEDIWLKIYDLKNMQHEFFFISEFHNNRGESLTYQAVWERCRVIGKKTGLLFTPEDFRHTYAATLGRDKEGIKRLRELLGKTNLSYIDQYLQIAKHEPIMEELIPFYESYGVIHG